MELEFLDDTPPDEDLLDGAGGAGGAGWMRWAGAGAAVLLLILAGFVVANRHDPAPTPHASPTPITSASPPTYFRPLPKALAGGDETLASVYLRATDPALAADVARTGSNAGSCRQVPIGMSPQLAAGHAVATVLPAFSRFDAARIIDQNAGLCSLQVRLRANDGTVVVVIVTSPDAAAALARRQQLTAAETTVGPTAVEYARFVSHDGWTVVVGSTGPAGRQPPLVVLEGVAANAAVRW